ncbi:MAG TPA: ATP-binding protein [Lacunisphaera sp.]|nr:ATP-binding protein [Lacunisphaera sp.]
MIPDGTETEFPELAGHPSRQPEHPPELAADAIQAVLGRIRPDENADRKAAAERLERRRAESLAIRGRLPDFVRSAPRAELERRIHHPHILAAARGWAWGAGNVLFSGPTGLGKTTAAAMLFRAVLGRAVVSGGADWDKAQSLRWTNALELVGARRQQRMGAGEAGLITEACHARLLVIDELGWEKDPAEVSEVLSVRQQRQWPTVITTGLSIAELNDHYGAAVLRRMLESGGRKPVIVEAFPVAKARGGP